MKKFILAVIAMIFAAGVCLYFSYISFKNADINIDFAALKEVFTPDKKSGKQKPYKSNISRERYTKEVDELSKLIIPGREDEFIVEGNNYAAQNNYTSAIMYYDAVIKAVPSSARAYANRGGVKIELKDYSGAIEDCTIAISLDPQRENSYVNRALAYNKTGDYFKAIEDSEVIINMNGRYIVEAYNTKGLALYNMEKYAEAEEMYTKALELNRMELLYYNRGLANEKLGRYDEALEDFNKVIEFNGHNSNNFYMRGKVKEAKGDLYGAKDDYRTAAGLGSKHAVESLERLEQGEER